jgi:hypothetical protein
VQRIPNIFEKWRHKEGSRSDQCVEPFDRLAGDAPNEHDFSVVPRQAARERQDPAL